MKNSDQLVNDYERMVPEFHKDALMYAEHLTRYQAALDVVKGKVVLDIASGSGYGSQLLANNAKYVYGIDVNETAVNYATKHFGAQNLEYIVGDGERIPLADGSVDVVVTFETIEHIRDYKKFIKEVKRVLRHDGIAIVSTPNDLEFAEGNHFHLHEFEYNELVSLLKEDFANVDSYYQGTWKYVAVGSPEDINTEGVKKLAVENLAVKTPDQYLYFYLLCSNREITENISPVAALGEHYSDRTLVKKESDHLEVENHLAEQLEKVKQEAAHYVEQFKNEHKYRVTLENELDRIRSSKVYRLYAAARSVKHKVMR